MINRPTVIIFPRVIGPAPGMAWQLSTLGVAGGQGRGGGGVGLGCGLVCLPAPSTSANKGTGWWAVPEESPRLVSLLTGLQAYLPVWLLSFLSACLCTYLPACLLTHLSACLCTDLPACLLYLSTYLPNYLLTYIFVKMLFTDISNDNNVIYINVISFFFVWPSCIVWY